MAIATRKEQRRFLPTPEGGGYAPEILMTEPNIWNEPPVDPLDDTSPSLSMRPVGLDQRIAEQQDAPHEETLEDLPTWRRAVGVLSLIGAMAFTLATVVVFTAQRPAPTVNNPAPTNTVESAATQEVAVIQATFTPPPAGATSAPPCR
jgi:hypothetical protein